MSIVKSFTRKSSSFGQLAEYISRPGAVMSSNGQPVIFRHNLLGKTVSEVEQEYKDNEANRISLRKNSVRLYHDIISYRHDNAWALNPEVLDGIFKKYVELRSDKALYYAAPHRDKDHVHLHVMVSGVEAFSGRPISISKADYQNVKNRLQEYEIEKGLGLSAVMHGKGDRQKGDREYQLEKRTGQMSRKEEIRQLLEQSFTDALSREQFYVNAQNLGLKFYERGGEIKGVDDQDTHYRLSTLQYGEERMSELDGRQERLADLSDVRGDRLRSVEQGTEEQDPEQGKSDKLEIKDEKDLGLEVG